MDMTEDEQKAWWLEQAETAMNAMGMPDAKIEWLAFTHHVVFDVSHAGQDYILKIADTGINAMSELAVLIELNKQGIAAPQFIQAVRLPAGLFELLAMLIAKLEGEEKSVNKINLQDVQSIGSYLGRLHKSSFATLSELRKLDYLALFSDKGLYPLDEDAKVLFSARQLNIMDTVTHVVKVAMDELGQGENEFGLIHGDLLLKNILFYEGEVRALDFEYCGWGYYLYDLCPLLWQLKPLPNYKELEEAFWNGYCSIRPLTERHRQLLETFIAARQVASLRWVAANQHNPAYQGKVANILQQRTAELQGFLETGILKRN